MKQLLIGTCAALAMVAAAGTANAKSIDTRANGASVTPIPIDNWALRDVITNIEINPAGTMMLIVKNEAKDGEYLVELRETSDLSKSYRRLAANPMEIISAQWVTDDIIFGTAWQVTRKSVGGPEEDIRDYITYAYNVKTDKWSKLATSEFSKAGGNITIEEILPKEPNKVLISTRSDPGGGVNVQNRFRPVSYYKLDLIKGTKELVYRGNRERPNVGFDADGNMVFSETVDGDIITVQVRAPGATEWVDVEVIDLSAEDNLYRVLGGIHGWQGMKGDGSNTGYIIDNTDGDKAALYEVDMITGGRMRKVFEAPGADVMGVRRSSNRWAGDTRVVGAIYPGAKFETEWFDQKEKALYEKIERQIPNAHQVRISSRSRDGQKMVVYNSGPKDPGSYYFLDGNKLMPLGSRNPTIDPNKLADVEFARFNARDGLSIPVYITKPKGEGPFPTIILPHGGPHVNEVIGYDEWGQILASNGYMVAQPQYRMSVGWGQDHFDKAYGQHGLAMQDDKDDTAKYLVERGLADPDRLAMFGWSYGGYAALVAASREDNMYQCTIAGAAVADPEKVYKARRSPWSPKALDEWSKRRGTIGINPIKEVSNVNIPLLMIHPKDDRRVLYYNMKDYQKAAKKAGTDSKMKFVTMDGADHFYTTLMNDHQTTLFTEMLTFLKEDCGPGGL